MEKCIKCESDYIIASSVKIKSGWIFTSNYRPLLHDIVFQHLDVLTLFTLPLD